MKVYKGVAESLLNTISLIGKSEIKQEASEPRVVEHLWVSILPFEILNFFRQHIILI